MQKKKEAIIRKQVKLLNNNWIELRREAEEEWKEEWILCF